MDWSGNYAECPHCTYQPEGLLSIRHGSDLPRFQQSGGPAHVAEVKWETVRDKFQPVSYAFRPFRISALEMLVPTEATSVSPTTEESGRSWRASSPLASSLAHNAASGS